MLAEEGSSMPEPTPKRFVRGDKGRKQGLRQRNDPEHHSAAKSP